ncbi:CTP synthase-like isoform X4 [Belonocnema kinseyi]|uniref:CTP synthase-like isoform X4 n=1 Tax=Belonocnema kinseyi TaxID=2817044 RepID=UPI00143D3B71|nr:CTP synthase-like isoform X4 [Belonocnema kinseyi]
MKYILVTGGVISGVGKGVIASSFGTILKHCGIHVTSIKIDPYINIDAGTFSPYEHGEVYVLDDGGEVDLDLGNYERFLDVTLHKDNNITTGKIYQSVIEKERRGEYLGKTVQVVPHITDAVQEWVERVANHSVSEDGNKPEVITIHDLSSIYRVPLLMESQGVIPFLSDRLQLNVGIQQPRNFMRKWRDLAERIEHLRKEVVIALVGKYTKLEDSYASVTKALQHASVQVGYKLKLKYIEACNLEKTKLQSDPVIYYEAWQQLCKSDGVVVPGGFGKRGMEGKIKACKWCRTNNTPFLGICLGMQAAVIEFARDVLHLSNANSTEIDNETENPLVIDMPEHNQGQMGGTMRLGKRRTRFSGENSVIKQLYGNKNSVEERHRHRYEINPKYVGDLQAAGMKFVGHDEQSERMEIVELEGHSYYVATQYHPEYLSRPLKPSPPFLGLILASVGKLKSYLSSGCRFSPAQLSDNDFDDDYPVESTNSLKVVSSTKPTNSNVSGSD